LQNAELIILAIISSAKEFLPIQIETYSYTADDNTSLENIKSDVREEHRAAIFRIKRNIIILFRYSNIKREVIDFPLFFVFVPRYSLFS
jgi:aspartyl/asparaginyl-tRNA synthetase